MTLGALICAIIGLLLASTPLGEKLRLISYDAAFLPNPPIKPTDDDYFNQVVVLELSAKLERTNLATALDYLGAEQARLVVLDLLFETNSQQDDILGAAILRNGRVMLAAENKDYEYSENGALATRLDIKPLVELIATNAMAIGVVNFPTNSDNRVRGHAMGTPTCPSLAYQAAISIDRSATSMQRSNLWLNFYREPCPISWMPYDDWWSSRTNNNLHNKIVFIGYDKHAPDAYGTSLSTWGHADKWPGVRILACNFLNLWKGDFLSSMTTWKEYFLILVAGLLFGGAASTLRPRLCLLILLVVILVTPIVAVWNVWKTHVWFNWIVIGFCQTSVAAAVCLIFAKVQSKGEIVIPAHTVHRFLAKGGCGEVWLATNDLLSKVRAVKVIRRERLKLYEKELEAVRTYEDISRKHEGLLQILQVGKDDARGYFYYVMELADDEVRRDTISLKEYYPRTLGNDLKHKGKLDCKELAEVGIDLARALDFLHRQGRVHRDIKPDNIVYIAGKPKLADPGFVTTFSRPDISQPGTPRFMDKETHGTPLGDIYSLGRTLQFVADDTSKVISTQSCDSAMPYSESAISSNDPELRAEFDSIVRRACAPKEERYQSAQELCEELNGFLKKFFRSESV